MRLFIKFLMIIMIMMSLLICDYIYSTSFSLPIHIKITLLINESSVNDNHAYLSIKIFLYFLHSYTRPT